MKLNVLFNIWAWSGGSRKERRERERQHTNFIIAVCTKRGIVGDDDDDDEWKNE